MIPDPSHVPAGIYFEHDPQQRFHDHFEYLAGDGGFAQTQNQHRMIAWRTCLHLLLLV